jgi:hypothetical protein
MPFLMRRDENWAAVITREVLDRGLRCVTIGGGSHFFRNLPLPNVVTRLEQKCRVSVVHTHAVATTPEVEQCVAGWPRPSIAATRHVAYGRLPATAVIADQLPGGVPATLTVADIADHVLFLGHRRELTAAVPEWEVFYEPAYWAELNRRKDVTGLPIDLWTLRQESDPAMFPGER